MIQFDKDFYDLDRVETKILKRFKSFLNHEKQISTDFDMPNQEEEIQNNKQFILIQTPTHCSCLQANITFDFVLIFQLYININNQLIFFKIYFK